MPVFLLAPFVLVGKAVGIQAAKNPVLAATVGVTIVATGAVGVYLLVRRGEEASPAKENIALILDNVKQRSRNKVEVAAAGANIVKTAVVETPVIADFMDLPPPPTPAAKQQLANEYASNAEHQASAQRVWSGLSPGEQQNLRGQEGNELANLALEAEHERRNESNLDKARRVGRYAAPVALGVVLGPVGVGIGAGNIAKRKKDGKLDAQERLAHASVKYAAPVAKRKVKAKWKGLWD